MAALKNKCSDRGLPVGGNKQELIDRLRGGGPSSIQSPGGCGECNRPGKKIKTHCYGCARFKQCHGSCEDDLSNAMRSMSIGNSGPGVRQNMTLDERDKYIETKTFEVKNSSGSSVDTGRNWLKEWKEATGKRADQKCIIKGCGKDAEAGGHLKVKGRTYVAIGGICRTHNSTDKEGLNGWLKTKANTTLWFLIKNH